MLGIVLFLVIWPFSFNVKALQYVFFSISWWDYHRVTWACKLVARTETRSQICYPFDLLLVDVWLHCSRVHPASHWLAEEIEGLLTIWRIRWSWLCNNPIKASSIPTVSFGDLTRWVCMWYTYICDIYIYTYIDIFIYSYHPEFSKF